MSLSVTLLRRDGRGHCFVDPAEYARDRARYDRDYRRATGAEARTLESGATKGFGAGARADLRAVGAVWKAAPKPAPKPATPPAPADSLARLNTDIPQPPEHIRTVRDAGLHLYPPDLVREWLRRGLIG